MAQCRKEGNKRFEKKEETMGIKYYVENTNRIKRKENTNKINWEYQRYDWIPEHSVTHESWLRRVKHNLHLRIRVHPYHYKYIQKCELGFFQTHFTQARLYLLLSIVLLTSINISSYKSTQLFS